MLLLSLSKHTNGSSSVQGVIESAKKGRKGAIDAITQICAKGDEVALEIEGQRSGSTDSRRGRADGHLAGSLAVESALHSPDPIAGCEAFEEAKRALQRFRSLTARYEATSTDAVHRASSSGPAEPRWMRWRQDVVDLTALNARVKRLARQVTEGHLAPTGCPALTEPQAGADDQDLAQIALEILDEATPKGAATWGAAAAQLVDVYGRTLKETF
ncbi:hypothetical protein ISF_05667 [Cordyceps fumosorosea ARSEF 2679]|uniref:Uncharacterized protein n=1 Tax=Cordyceps fumosorosea (strain ARSEF 2679) TaxID=1081104 RepID=A0A167TIC1_CORFA|nr:hypothetical protein ISF_05667 [Cordyceps fumosorosea ARSEF 2679]OAA60628.1 hypothetical protein ISF_05667 [Cordyceps fumosorosea ARSEF 2679]